MNRVFLLLAFFVVFQSCSADSKSKQNNEKENSQPKSTWQPPVSGTVVDSFVEKVAEDKLNNSYFRVVVETTAESKNGNYTLKLEYGYNKNETTIDLPKWYKGIILKPVLKAGENKYECELGFDAGDGVFKEFYQIKVEKGDIKLKQIKGYYTT